MIEIIVANRLEATMLAKKEVSWNLDEPVDGRLYLSKFCASQLPVKRALDYEDDDIHN